MHVSNPRVLAELCATVESIGGMERLRAEQEKRKPDTNIEFAVSWALMLINELSPVADLRRDYPWAFDIPAPKGTATIIPIKPQ